MHEVKLLKLLVLSACCLAGVLPARAAVPAGSGGKIFLAGCASGTGKGAWQPGPKPAGVKRVFVLGGPEARLLGVPAGTPGLEVINCGAPAGSPARLKELAVEIMKYDPDLLAVLYGADGSVLKPAPGLSFASLRARYYAFKYGPREARLRTDLQERRAVLAAVAAAARSGKVPAVFCTMPANLELPPSGALLPEKDSFADGMSALVRGDFGAAAGDFQRGLVKGRYDPYSRFYLAKAQEGLKRFADARANYLLAIEEDLGRDRTTPAMNAMIRAAAAAGGAGLCDLESAFYSLPGGGIPGFGQFSGPSDWRPAYNGFIWSKIAAAAKAKGADVLNISPATPPEPAFTAKDLAADAENAASALSARLEACGGGGGERILAEIGFLEGRSPGLLERTAVQGKKGHISGPDLYACLAEAYRRSGAFKKALSFAARAIAARPGDPRYRLLKARCLLGLARVKEGGAELQPLYSVPADRTAALAYGRAYGLIQPGGPVPGAAPGASAAASKELADEAVTKMFAGDRAGAGKALAKALEINPLDAEALMTLCSLKSAEGKLNEALTACGSVPGAAASGPPFSADTLTSEALYAKAMLLLKLGKKEEAAECLRYAAGSAPAGWPGLPRALAGLEELEKPAPAR